VKVRGGRYGVDILGSDAIRVRNLRCSLQAWGVRHYLPAGSTVQGDWDGLYCEGASAGMFLIDTGTIKGLRCENATSQGLPVASRPSTNPSGEVDGSVGVWDLTDTGLSWDWAAGAEYIYLSETTTGHATTWSGSYAGYDATDFFEPMLPIELTDSAGKTHFVGISEVNDAAAGALANTLRVINYSNYCRQNATVTGDIGVTAGSPAVTPQIRRFMGVPIILHRGEGGLIDPSVAYNLAYTDMPVGVIYPGTIPTVIMSGRSNFSNMDQTNKLRIAGWTSGAASSALAPQPAVTVIGGHRVWDADHPLATYTGYISDNKSIAPYYTAPESSIRGRKWVAEGPAGTRTSDSESTELEFVQIDGEWGQDLNYSTTGKSIELYDLVTAANHTFNISIRMRAHTGSSGQAVKIYFLNRSTGTGTPGSTLDEYVVKNWTLTESWATYAFTYTTAAFSNEAVVKVFVIRLLNNAGTVVTPAYVGKMVIELVADVAVPENVTATSGGLTTGLINLGTTFAAITSSNATFIATLPAATVGQVIRGAVTATGCEIRTPAASGETINNVDSDGTNEMALPANTSFRAECYVAGAWVVTRIAADGTETQPVPDA